MSSNTVSNSDTKPNSPKSSPPKGDTTNNEKTDPTSSSGTKTNSPAKSAVKTDTTPNSGAKASTNGKHGPNESNNKLSTPKLPAYDLDLLKKKGFTIGKALNSGSFSTVCRADMNGKPVAVKIIDLSKTSKDYEKKFLPRELNAMVKLKHPNIITVHQIYTLQGVRIYVFMDLADGGDILDLVKSGPCPENKAKVLYKGVAEGLEYIHKEGFAHRDIKSENILLNKERTVAKLGDFGFSRTCFNHETGERLLSNTFCGSACYAAPEILMIKPYNAMISDIWSMGVVLYVMVNCRLPFTDKKLRNMLKQELKKKLEFKSSISESCRDLIGHHLEPDVKLRYTMKQVLQHKWFQ